MKKYLFKTNLFISLILLAGFAFAAWLGNKANYRAAIENLELVTSLTADGTFYQFSQLLDKPINIALTMANDTLLARQLEQAEAGNPEFSSLITDYLSKYYQKYKFDSVFLVPTATSHYYTFSGLDCVLKQGEQKAAWYYKFLESGRQFEVNIDNNIAQLSNNEMTIFINCRIDNTKGETIGVVGVGFRTDNLRNILAHYEKDYDVEAFFIDKSGKIEVSSYADDSQGKNIFQLFNIDKLQNQLLAQNNSAGSHGCWVDDNHFSGKSWYFVTRYLPNLSWYVVIGHNTSQLISDIKSSLFESVIILAFVVLAIIFIIGLLIKSFNRHIAAIIEQRHKIFKKATEKLYDNIFEWNIDKNTFVDKNTEKYIKKLGDINSTYEDSIKLIADKQIGDEFCDDYLATFSRKNIIEKFKEGTEHLQFEFQSTNDGIKYHWLRIDAHIFYSPDDHALHMFTYRKNIDSEKYKEFLANIDEMTQCYTKKATERIIDDTLENEACGMYAFFIIDIDNFKQANDQFGHAFGDICIKKFAAIIRSHFREEDIVGRLGGDEFAVFIPIADVSWLTERAATLSRALNFICTDGNAKWQVSASIGVSVCPVNGTSFSELYHRADEALYQMKQNGKNGYTFAKQIII